LLFYQSEVWLKTYMLKCRVPQQTPNRQINVSRLAQALGVSRPTVYSHMKKYSITQAFSNISDLELDRAVAKYKELCPSAGIRFLMGHLRSVSIRVQRKRDQGSLKRVDGVGSHLRKRKAIKR
jgi:DNA-binding transcriptional ArsR family regulator